MLYADGIIFDKDGTLMDFDAFWVSVTVKAMEDVLGSVNMDLSPMEEILEAFGVHNGVTDVDAVLCKGTYRQMGEIVYKILSRLGCSVGCDEMVKLVVDAYNRNADAGEVKPTCPCLGEVLRGLKAQGKKLAVVTTDNHPITKICLERLGIADLFDVIYADDGKTPSKPDPYCVVAFCKETGVEKDRVLMVGDTLTDIRFAKNAGIPSVGIAKTPRGRELLEPHADAVIPDPSLLPALLG